MGLITKGMGAVLKHIKKGRKALKRDARFYGVVGAVEAGKHGYNIVKGKKDIHEGTITGTIKHIKKARKK